MSPFIHLLLTLYCPSYEALSKYAVTVTHDGLPAHALDCFMEPEYRSLFLSFLPEYERESGEVLVAVERISGVIQQPTETP